MPETEAAIKSLGAFPVVQAAVALLVILAGIYLVFRGNRDKKPANGVPAWTLYGPVADVMKSIHEMTEQSREGNKTLGRIESAVHDIGKEQREATMLLEDIRNNQVQRGDIVPSPVRRKPL